MLPNKIRFISQSGFRGEAFLEINQSKHELSVAALFASEMGRNGNRNRGPSIDAFYQIFHFIWESSYRGEDFLEINQSETRMACGGHIC